MSDVAEQHRPWSCGAAAIVNAAAVLGVDVSEAQVASAAGTDSDGTSEEQIIRAAAQLGLHGLVMEEADDALAFDWLQATLSDGYPAILCVDEWEHWVVAAALANNGIVVLDSVDGSEEVLAARDLIRRWRCRGAEMPFYAIALAAGPMLDAPAPAPAGLERP